MKKLAFGSLLHRLEKKALQDFRIGLYKVMGLSALVKRLFGEEYEMGQATH